MADHFFPAVVRPALFGFLVGFPDIPGLAVTGDTIDKAAEKAEIALRRHLIELLERRAALPEPSALDTVPVDLTAPEVARMLVKVSLPDRPAAAHSSTRTFADPA